MRFRFNFNRSYPIQGIIKYFDFGMRNNGRPHQSSKFNGIFLQSTAVGSKDNNYVSSSLIANLLQQNEKMHCSIKHGKPALGRIEKCIICIQSTLIMSIAVNSVNAANLIEIIWHKICRVRVKQRTYFPLVSV
jgi:hypothetical protein